jgi:hypothetical protein
MAGFVNALQDIFLNGGSKYLEFIRFHICIASFYKFCICTAKVENLTLGKRILHVRS